MSQKWILVRFWFKTSLRLVLGSKKGKRVLGMAHSNIAAADVGQKDLSTVYKIRGGKESDAILHPDTIAKFQGKHFNAALDVGVGRGGFTKLLPPFVESLTVSDYEQEHVDRTIAQLKPDILLEGQRLDISGDLKQQLGENASYDLITCLSVLMHLSPIESEKAIQKMYNLLKPGGKLLIATICREVAEQAYTPAPWLGEDVFIPRIAGIKKCEMNESRLSELVENPFSLAEYYPENLHYVFAAQQTGGEFSAYALEADERCLKSGNGGRSIYAKLAEQRAPLWGFVEIDKK